MKILLLHFNLSVEIKSTGDGKKKTKASLKKFYLLAVQFLDREQETYDFVDLFFLVSQHEVWSPAARASYWWCLKSIFQQLQSFWLSDKSAWQKMQAFFPGRMSSLSAALCWPFLLHHAPGRVTGSPRLSLSCWRGWGRRWPGHAPGRVRHQDPVSSWSWSWAQSRTGTQQTHSPLDFGFPAWKGHLLCDTLDLLLLRTAILINLSSSFVKPGCIPMPCFCTSSLLSSAAPKFPALAGLKAAPAHFPVSQSSASFWLPLSALVWEQPQSPASLYLAV